MPALPACKKEEAMRSLQDLQRNFSGEQLAYIATLAVGAQLIFGDRPKSVTYGRLLTLPTLAELDAAFGTQVVAAAIMLIGCVPEAPTYVIESLQPGPAGACCVPGLHVEQTNAMSRRAQIQSTVLHC